MKRMFCILCALTMLFLLCACKDNDTHKKDSVKDFITLLKDIAPSGLTSRYKIDEDNCYNVTPAAVAAETNMKIFKFSDSCASFVMLDNNVYPLCDWFGGYGFVNAVPCDFDNDGNKDLLVASSWGSGMHRSIISLFNSVSKESTALYDTSSTDTPRMDLIVTTATSSFSSEETENLPIYYHIYSAKIEVNNGNFAELSYVPTEFIGSIEVVNGTPTFKPYNKEACAVY